MVIVKTNQKPSPPKVGPCYTVTVQFSGSQTYELDFESLTGEPTYEDYRKSGGRLTLDNGDELFFRSLLDRLYRPNISFDELLSMTSVDEILMALMEFNMIPDDTRITLEVKLLDE